MSLKWNDEADEILRREVAKYTREDGTIDWSEVNKAFPSREENSPRNRWDRIEHGRLANPPQDATPEEDRPSEQKLFEYMRDNPRSLKEISNHFNVSPKAVEEKIHRMKEKGYRLVFPSPDSYMVITSTMSEVNPPAISIAELMGKRFCFAIASDWHIGSRHAQPTRLNQFIKLAYEEHDVRHILVPGDITDGAYVYKGHLDDLIPQCRPLSRDRSWMTARAEAQLVDLYLPQYDGLRYFTMGGNHDMSLIINTGMDPIRMVCDNRNDMHYGGYSVWSIRLTEKSYVRLVHPRGGVSYAKSYKLQKRMEQLAFEALRQAMTEEEPPMTSILVMGHFHVVNFDLSAPMFGLLAGCFQGQTTLLKELGLTPQIAGWIVEVQFEKYGKLSQLWPKPIILDEIEDDWKNWPVPKIQDPEYKADNLDMLILFTGEAPEPPATPSEEPTTISPS